MTWRTGDGGTALVFILFHQAILAHWFDVGAHPAHKDKVVNYLLEQRVLNDFIDGLAFSLWYHLAFPPSPSPFFRQKARPATHRKTEKKRQLAD